MQVQHLRQVELNEWQARDAMGSLGPSGTSSLQTAATDASSAGSVPPGPTHACLLQIPSLTCAVSVILLVTAGEHFQTQRQTLSDG